MTKYEILLNILDQLRGEAPPTNKRYHPADTDSEGLNQARSRAFIHLYLKVKFGLLDFRDRERVITDGDNDGGIDAYHIDQEAKKAYFIQSKFRTTEKNFQAKEIQLIELLSMDIKPILEGVKESKYGPYNGKIQQLQRDVRGIRNIGIYDYEVVLLANLTEPRPGKLEEFFGFPTTVFDHERTYNELVFPVVKGTYYNPAELTIYIKLTNMTSPSARVSYKVVTSQGDCDIAVFFVPTLEIAKTMYKYKNSILEHNPRSYLELANNTVNEEIKKTITDLNTNEFALYNNGITMLGYWPTKINENIGEPDTAQLVVNRPQIINGGQTAFTLSRLYEEHINDEARLAAYFANKDVMLKVITIRPKGDEDAKRQLELIDAVSKATNQQTPVDEADRRSNEPIQIQMQNAIYSAYGYFYERKKGEYADGVRAGYIRRSQIIKRDIFIRLCKACDLQPAEARRFKHLFKEDNFSETLNDVNRYQEYFFAFKCHEALHRIIRDYSNAKGNKFGLTKFGYALQYGEYAVVSVCRRLYEGKKSLGIVDEIVNQVLGKWLRFESYASKQPHNNRYVKSSLDKASGVQMQVFDFANYYKGQTLNDELEHYFKRIKIKTSKR